MIHYVLRQVSTNSDAEKGRDLNAIEAEVNSFVQNPEVTVSLVTPMFQLREEEMWVGAMMEYTMRRR